MNFFERQAQARRTSTRLLVLFALAVVGIVLAVDAAVWIAWGPPGEGPPSPGVLAFASLATLAVIGLGSLYRIASLRSFDMFPQTAHVETVCQLIPEAA